MTACQVRAPYRVRSVVLSRQRSAQRVRIVSKAKVRDRPWAPAQSQEIAERCSAEARPRRLFGLVEPIPLVTSFGDEPTHALMALGLPSSWDGVATVARWCTRRAPRWRPTIAPHVSGESISVDPDAGHIASFDPGHR